MRRILFGGGRGEKSGARGPDCFRARALGRRGAYCIGMPSRCYFFLTFIFTGFILSFCHERRWLNHSSAEWGEAVSRMAPEVKL